jgi:hypothetical protein
MSSDATQQGRTLRGLFAIVVFSFALRLAPVLKTPWRDGTTHILMERHELLERVAPLIPPPRAHQVRYHGILAPCARGRDQVVPVAGRVRATSAGAVGAQNERGIVSASNGGDAHTSLDVTHRDSAAPITVPGKSKSRGGQKDTAVLAVIEDTKSLTGPASLASRPDPPALSSRIPWAELLKRVFGVEALRCPCGKMMRVMAAITDPAVAKRILVCMSLPSRAPPLEPTNLSHFAAEPWLEDHATAEFDQTPTWDEWSQVT